ncbi:hypothetical protein BDDG_12688, partial [Blastomyces dermatitidis ATCC 18188]
SLSPSKFSEQEFEEFREMNMNAFKKKSIVCLIISIIEDHINDVRCMKENYSFKNFAPLTDGTLANAKPDHFFNTQSEQLNCQIHDELSDFIISLIQKDHLIASNFFQETKGPDRSPAVATQQACYNDASGACAHTQARSELLSTSEREATSEPTIILEDSDTSATFDEAEFHDAAQWSFAHTNDSADDPPASTKHTKRARIGASSISRASSKSLQN